MNMDSRNLNQRGRTMEMKMAQKMRRKKIEKLKINT